MTNIFVSKTIMLGRGLVLSLTDQIFASGERFYDLSLEP